MILSPAVQAFVCRDTVDMRRGVDGLLQLVGQAFTHDVFSGQVFTFVGRRRDRIKMLTWTHPGMQGNLRLNAPSAPLRPALVASLLR